MQRRVEGGLEVGGEFGGCVGVGWRRFKIRGLDFVETDGGSGEWVPAVDSELGLVDVGGGADEVDGYTVGGDEAGEVEKLVEMPLCCKRDHNHSHFRLFSTKLVMVLIAVIGHGLLCLHCNFILGDL